jgi:Phage tail tube protein
MPTSALPRGKTVTLLLKSQTDFTAAPGGDWTRTFAYSHTMERKRPFEDDPLLGASRRNNRDATAPAPGLEVLDGNIVVPVDFNHFGLWLYALLGAAQVTGSADPYTHVFSSGGEVLPWRTHQWQLASNIFLQDIGLVGSKLDIEMARAGGFQKATVGFMGRTQAKLTASGGGSPALPWARDELSAALGTFKVNGAAAANIINVKASYDNKLTPQDYVNDPLRSGFDLDQEATFSGSIDLRFVDSTYYDLAAVVGGTPFTAELLWQKSASRSLSLFAASMRIEPVGVPISGPGRIQQTFNFRAEQTSGANMLVATLKSSVPSYAI